MEHPLTQRGLTRSTQGYCDGEGEILQSASPHNAVFFLWYEFEGESYEEDDSKLVGVYSSRGAALAALDRLKDKPGFREADNNCLQIEEYELGLIHWEDGYCSVDVALQNLTDGE